MVPVKIGVIGDYDAKKPSHPATVNAIIHAAKRLNIPVETVWLPTKKLQHAVLEKLAGFDALFCAPGSPYESYEGAINAIRYARELNVPFLGTCGGFQHMVMEFAQDVAGIKGAAHEELDPGAEHYIISQLSCSLAGESATIKLREGTLARELYGRDTVTERFNCRYGLNAEYLDALTEKGLRVSGTDENGEVRIFELPENNFYIATLFQPQLSSSFENPHKLILAFVQAARDHRDSGNR
jgi:CTP synthase (UTP-ammonia lyase)